MRDPLNMNTIDTYNDDNYITLSIDQIPKYDLMDWDVLSGDEKEFTKYISSIEKDVRTSFEYRQYINFLRQYLDMNCCSFFSNVNNIDNTKIKIEIHHEPLSLYDICLIVYNKRCYYRESLEEEMVAKEVMYLHYKLLVGLIPLSETVHELVHNQYLFVPTDRVLGHYKQFLDLYHDFILPEQFDILDRIENATNCYREEEYTNVLMRNYIYLDLSGAYKLPRYEDVLQAMKNRIDYIRNNPNNNGLIKPFYSDNNKK